MQLVFNKTLILIAALALSSCAMQKVVFTPEIKEQNSFTETELKKIQFYTSDVIVLYHSKKNGNLYIEHGKILLNNSNQYETIIIPKNTPCILEKVIDEKLLLSFEYGNGKILYFTSNGSRYSLCAKNWKDGIGQIHYANKEYFTNSGTVVLTVKMKKLQQIINRERTVYGRVIY